MRRIDYLYAGIIGLTAVVVVAFYVFYPGPKAPELCAQYRCVQDLTTGAWACGIGHWREDAGFCEVKQQITH